MAAAELLQVDTTEHIPAVVLVVGIVHQTIGVLGEALLADKVRALHKVALVVIVGETKLLELVVGAELGIVAITIGIVQGYVVAPVG